MKKNIKELILILSVIVCSVIAFAYSRAIVVSTQQTNSGTERDLPAEAETVTETVSEIESILKSLTATAANTASEMLSDGTNPDNKEYSNEEFFSEYAEGQGIDRGEADKYWDMLLADNIFKDDTMRLTGLVIEDMDGNGQNDLLAMVLNREDWAFYGTGCVWFYMNNDEPYCFDSGDYPYYGYFDFFAEDIDNDDHTELVLSALGSGCGAAGDTHNAIFKYKDHALERMELPSDSEAEYDHEIYVSVWQEAVKNQYSAYCSYFDEEIFFESENIFEPSRARCVGGNVRGFYNLRPIKYQGKNALQASEYLSGEGGNVHNVGTAQFIIQWDKNGHSYVDRWWIETTTNTYANSKGCRITYADGYYYYASQLDHYYLYRVKEDGSDAACLAKVHPGSIQVDKDNIYFVNLSDHNAIYRIGTDGSNMVKLCDSSDNHMQLTEEYIYFCSTYDKAYDIRGLVDTEHDMTGYHPSDGYLYRIRKDGSGKELILTDVEDYILAQAASNNVIYEGNIYCKRLHQNETTRQWEAIVMVYDLDGNDLNESYPFDFYGEVLVSRDQIYCFGYGNDDGNICMYTTWNNEMTTLPNQSLRSYCIYNVALYALNEEVDHEKRTTQIYNFSPDTNKWVMIYENTAVCTASGGNYDGYRLSDLYATEQGVFLRQFVSSEEGVRWFVIREGQTITSWEDETKIPMTQPAVQLKYTGDSSIKSCFQSTDGYEDYLDEDLTYQTFYAKDEAGNSCCPYTVCLPQFNEKIKGYRKINKYFQDAYQESVETLQAEFAEMVKDKKTTEYGLLFLYEGTSYDYVYIGEKYITVAMYQYGYDGGIRSWTTEKPVTFERDTGKIITLEDLYGMPVKEVVSYATSSIYKYAESIGRGSEAFFIRDKDLLTTRYNPEQFFLFPDGIGLYYTIYAIADGASGDYVFIIPFPDKE